MLLAAAVTCLVPIVAAYAIEGWNRGGDEWQYLNREDQLVTSAFKKSKDDWSYLDEGGLLLKNRIFSFDGDDFYVDQDGRMVRNAWISIDNEKDSDDNYGDSTWHYFGADDRGLHAKGKDFRKEIDGQAYAFDENGRVLIGWTNDGGVVLGDKNPFVNAHYYTDADGVLYTNCWLYYDWGSHLTNEVSGGSYEDYEKMWFYFRADSKKYRSREGEAPLRRDTDGWTYGFDESGVMVDWWNKVATVLDAVRSNPTSDVRVRYHNGYDGGPTLKNRWLWMYPSENLDASEDRDLECSWWRTVSKGHMYRNKILQVDEREYAFDGIGRMKTGFVLFGGRHEFVAQYDADAWDAAHFTNGDIYGIEKADLYLSLPDELNDGSMQVGKEITIELADGPRIFAFTPSGKAYGNRNCLQKKDNKSYINGLRFDAPEEQGYGVISQNIGTFDAPQYCFHVVGQNGRIVGGRRVLCAGDGCLLVVNGQYVGYYGDEDAPYWKNDAFYHYDRSNRQNYYVGGVVEGMHTPMTKDKVPDELSVFEAD